MSVIRRSSVVASAAALCLPVMAGVWRGPEAWGAKIILVAREWEDQAHLPLQNFLIAEGHTLTIGVFADAPPDAALLAANDLIIIARETDSTDYDDDGEELLWNAISLPMISLNALLQGGPAGTGTRWAWVSGNTRPTDVAVTGASAFDPFPDPAHRFLSGVGSTTILEEAAFGQQALSTAHELPEGATLAATIGGGLAYGLYEIPAGAESFGQGTFGGPRVGYVIGAEGAFAYTSSDGRQILRNIIASLVDGGGIIGDADGDGDVDGNDIAIWAQNFTGSGATGGTRSLGDFDGDGDIDGDDAAAWAQHFTGSLGGGGASAGLSTVPEPAAIALLGVGGSAALVRRRRQGR